ncbi:protein BRANCHLESS TRICHOME [Pyrus communis]|uniref:protein BRANCHLESS TRICHOME n=1 Tax=Pyrus communis TaxID=23211 RepID=UPI0035BFBE5A
MEKMFMMMSTNSTPPPSPGNTRNIEITTSAFPTWKLYENPFYNSQKPHQNPPLQPQNQQRQCQDFSNKQPQQEVHHCLHLPISARKLAASFWDLTFFKPVMESEMDYTRAQIIEMKAELEYQRKARKKLESSNKRLAKELGEERRAREAIERVCEELAREISFGKSEITKMRKEIEEERKMLRMAEVLREERVQMKLAEARLLFEEKVLELEGCKKMLCAAENSHFKIKHKNEVVNVASLDSSSEMSGAFCGDRNNDSVSSFSTATSREVLLGEKAAFSENSGGFSSMAVQKRASPEPENPHIKRGIKGFVEFPRVVRAIGSKSRHWGTKLECQKAQLRILMKQKSPIRSNSFIIS